MVLSSNTLFHFTNSIENLINILTNEFEPRYCLEEQYSFFLTPGNPGTLAIPQVSFCDIPLSNVNHHVRFYGSYAIGLTKDWGKKKGITPVHYYHMNSSFNIYFKKILKFVFDESHKAPVPAKIPLLQLLEMYKPYEGEIVRRGKKMHKIFYDEKEWRYMPDTSSYEDSADFPAALDEKDFLDKNEKAKAEMELLKHGFRLSFEPEDIQYIIVATEDEILPMVIAIERIKAKYSEDTKKILTTRILSLEHIIHDF